MMYFATYRKGAPRFEAQEPALIAQYPWGGDYRPHAEARLCFVAGQGLALRMTCAEPDPLARFTQPDDPVYKDSCLEFFLDCYPDLGIGYFNFECNANGALRAMFGPDRQRRRFLREERLAPVPQAAAFRTENGWGYELLLSTELIAAYYGCCDLEKGSIMAGNFYKCGDETPAPHFGCWAKCATSPQPNFHQPERFGQIIIA